jgi:hypothetical protein
MDQKLASAVEPVGVVPGIACEATPAPAPAPAVDDWNLRAISRMDAWSSGVIPSRPPASNKSIKSFGGWWFLLILEDVAAAAVDDGWWWVSGNEVAGAFLGGRSDFSDMLAFEGVKLLVFTSSVSDFDLEAEFIVAGVVEDFEIVDLFASFSLLSFFSVVDLIESKEVTDEGTDDEGKACWG